MFYPSVTVTNADNCAYTYKTDRPIEAGVVASFTHNATACKGVPFKLENKSFVNPDVYTWFLESYTKAKFLSKESATNARVQFDSPGTYKVGLTVSNKIGCIDTFYSNVNLSPPPIYSYINL